MFGVGRDVGLRMAVVPAALAALAILASAARSIAPPTPGPGTGGFITHNDVPTDPRCVAAASHNPGAVYGTQSSAPHCVPDTGRIDRDGLGPVKLGASEQTVRSELGPPEAVKRGFLRYCV